jgi:hypothetical protein
MASFYNAKVGAGGGGVPISLLDATLLPHLPNPSPLSPSVPSVHLISPLPHVTPEPPPPSLSLVVDMANYDKLVGLAHREELSSLF